MYEYRARLSRVIDGDTVDLQVDLGFHMKADLRFRVLGINTPELRGGTVDSRMVAQAAKARVRELLTCDGLDWPLQIKTTKSDSFGRWLAEIWFPHPDGLASLAAVLLEEGLAVPYEK